MSEKINELEQQIQLLKEQLETVQRECDAYKEETELVKQAIRDVSCVNNELIVHLSKLIGEVSSLSVKQNFTNARCNNLKYELLDPRLEWSKYEFPIIRNAEETIEEIIHDRKSMARFGDGEFASIAQISRPKFQRVDECLARRLEEVLHSRHPKMLIAIADNYGTLDKYQEFDADGIRLYMTENNARKQHMELLEKDRIYYDAYVSRPYVMYKDNLTEAPKKRFDHLKEIWKGRNVIVVEGSQTRMGVGNDLLDNATEIKRILAPATNSFDKYDDIYYAALEYGKEDTLFLIAMGPTAGVLAYDLTLKGYQALDIGHIDLEYEWFLAGQGKRVPVLNKYNNEYVNGDMVGNISDEKYNSQIMVDLS